MQRHGPDHRLRARILPHSTTHPPDHGERVTGLRAPLDQVEELLTATPASPGPTLSRLIRNPTCWIGLEYSIG
jgi:hypothetical protein